MAARTADPATPPPKSDAYTGMLIISLIALLVGCGLLFLDYNRYPSQTPPPPVKTPAEVTPPVPEAAPEKKGPEKGNEKAPPAPPVPPAPPAPKNK